MKKRILIIGVLLSLILVSLISAEKIGIDIGNYFSEEGYLDFKITLYDNENNKIPGNIEYIIKNPYSEIIQQGNVDSGGKINFNPGEIAYKGTWEISAKYQDISSKENFIIDEVKRADITLEEDYLIVRNIGNAIYDKDILIKIGEEEQTARVFLDIGQTKKIRLTGDGVYEVRVNDGSQEEDLVFSGISLTGNVIGLERVVEGSFWKKYPMVSLFLSVLGLVVVVIVVLKAYKKI